MTTKYTKGPWEIAEDCNENLFGDAISVDILDGRDFPIATVDATPIIHDWPRKFPNMAHWADGANDGRTQIKRPSEQVIANARLIAAAPDLLEALQRVAFCNEVGFLPDDVQNSVATAIAKATGEQE